MGGQALVVYGSKMHVKDLVSFFENVAGRNNKSEKQVASSGTIVVNVVINTHQNQQKSKSTDNTISDNKKTSKNNTKNEENNTLTRSASKKISYKINQSASPKLPRRNLTLLNNAQKSTEKQTVTLSKVKDLLQVFEEKEKAIRAQSNYNSFKKKTLQKQSVNSLPAKTNEKTKHFEENENTNITEKGATATNGLLLKQFRHLSKLNSHSRSVDNLCHVPTLPSRKYGTFGPFNYSSCVDSEGNPRITNISRKKSRDDSEIEDSDERNVSSQGKLSRSQSFDVSSLKKLRLSHKWRNKSRETIKENREDILENLEDDNKEGDDNVAEINNNTNLNDGANIASNIEDNVFKEDTAANTDNISETSKAVSNERESRSSWEDIDEVPLRDKKPVTWHYYENYILPIHKNIENEIASLEKISKELTNFENNVKRNSTQYYENLKLPFEDNFENGEEYERSKTLERVKSYLSLAPTFDCHEDLKELEDNFEEFYEPLGFNKYEIISGQDTIKKTKLRLKLRLQELLVTERKYLGDLKHINQKYYSKIKNRCLEIPSLIGKHPYIFGNIGAIYGAQRRFFKELKRRGLNYQHITGTFVLYEAIFTELYPYYFRTNAKSKLYLEDFKPFILEIQQEINDNLDLQSYLMTPIQRLCKYKLFLEGIIKDLKKLNINHDGADAAFTSIESIIKLGNDWVAFDSISGNPYDSISTGSYLMRDEFLIIKPKKYIATLFLFEDLLIFTTKDQKNSDRFLFKDAMYMNELGLVNYDQHPFIFLIEKFKAKEAFSYQIQARTSEIKEKWINCIEQMLWEQLHKLKYKEEMLNVSDGEIFEKD